MTDIRGDENLFYCWEAYLFFKEEYQATYETSNYLYLNVLHDKNEEKSSDEVLP